VQDWRSAYHFGLKELFLMNPFSAAGRSFRSSDRIDRHVVVAIAIELDVIGCRQIVTPYAPAVLTTKPVVLANPLKS